MAYLSFIVCCFYAACHDVFCTLRPHSLFIFLTPSHATPGSPVRRPFDISFATPLGGGHDANSTRGCDVEATKQQVEHNIDSNEVDYIDWWCVCSRFHRLGLKVKHARSLLQ
jgi:hypothetical protein